MNPHNRPYRKENIRFAHAVDKNILAVLGKRVLLFIKCIVPHKDKVLSINNKYHITMEITGKLIQILPNVEGDGQRGHWVKGGFVIETGDDYPRKVAFITFGEERVAMVKNIPMGQLVQVTFNPESREFNERWYTDLRCSRVQPFVPGQMPAASTGYAWAGNQAPAPAAPQQPAAAPADQNAGFAAAPTMPAASEDDLPF